MESGRKVRVEWLLEDSRVLREECVKALAEGDRLWVQTRRLLAESEQVLARALRVARIPDEPPSPTNRMT